MVQEKVEELTEKLCDNYCRFPIEVIDQDELDNICMKCPLNEITEVLLNV